MSDEWWKAAPLANSAPAADKWWESAPLVEKPQAPIDEGDWKGLGDRLAVVENKARDAGPTRPQDIAEVRREAAKEQGRLYGSKRGAGETLLRRATDSFALGLPSYLEAATSGWRSGMSFPERHEFIKAADEGRGETNPASALTGKVAGGVGQAVALPLGGATALSRILTGAAQTATLGAGQGAIESRGDLGSTLSGGGYGALAGLAGGAIGEGLIAGGRAVFDPLRGMMKSGPVDEQAAARILYSARKAGVTPTSVRKTVDELGPDAFLADTLGRHGEALARSTANISPAARDILESASKQRLGGQTDRVVQSLMDAGGFQRPTTVDDLLLGAAETARPRINAAYKSAKSQGYDLPNTPFKWMDDSPMAQQALREAEARTGDRIAAFGPDEASKFAVMDYARQILANQGFKEGDSVAKGLARRLNSTIDDALPEASGARSLAQDLKQRQAALALGQEGARINPGIDYSNRIAALGLPPRPEIGKGYAAEAIDRIMNRKAGQNALDMLTGSAASRQAMEAALGARAADVAKRINAERRFMAFDRALSGNSSTARQLAEMGGLTVAGTAGGYLAGYDPWTTGIGAAALGAGRQGARKAVDALRARREQEVAPVLAELLTRQRLPALARTETARRQIVEDILRQGSRTAGLIAAQ